MGNVEREFFVVSLTSLTGRGGLWAMGWTWSVLTLGGGTVGCPRGNTVDRLYLSRAWWRTVGCKIVNR